MKVPVVQGRRVIRRRVDFGGKTEEAPGGARGRRYRPGTTRGDAERVATVIPMEANGSGGL